jgi:hypothetical protein
MHGDHPGDGQILSYPRNPSPDFIDSRFIQRDIGDERWAMEDFLDRHGASAARKRSQVRALFRPIGSPQLGASHLRTMILAPQPNQSLGAGHFSGSHSWAGWQIGRGYFDNIHAPYRLMTSICIASHSFCIEVCWADLDDRRSAMIGTYQNGVGDHWPALSVLLNTPLPYVPA